MKPRAWYRPYWMLTACLAMPLLAFAHGNVTPQNVNTEGLQPLGKE